MGKQFLEVFPDLHMTSEMEELMKLVEVVKGPHTSDEAVECARAFGEKTGKSPIVIQKEIAGFVANRINAAVTREACLLLEKGIASVEDIDTACD